VARNLRAGSELLTLPWFAPQHTFLEIRGRLAIHRAFKTESFDDDLAVLLAEKPLRLRGLAAVNRRRGRDLPADADLSAEAKAALRRVYARDLTLFGYY
jgi:hypothetical protein